MGNCLPSMSHGTKKPNFPLGFPKSSQIRRKKPRITGSRKSRVSGDLYPAEKGVIRVKLVLTKQEAAQLLSKCSRNDEKMKEILGELERIKRCRSEAATVMTGRQGSWRPDLESIPEAC